MIRNLWFKLIYRIVFVCISVTGLALQFVVEPTIITKTILNFFTIQSNIWILVMSIILLIFTIIEIRTKRQFNSKTLIIFKLIFAVSIMITFTTYNVILLPFSYKLTNYVFWEISNIIVHIIAPIMFLFDFLYFDGTKTLNYKNCFWATIPPTLYLIYSLINAELGITYTSELFVSRYPYFFLDLDLFGWFGSDNGLGVAFWIFLLIAMTILLSIAEIWAYNIIREQRIKNAKK